MRAPAGQLGARMFERGQPGFEEACRATVRNQRRPARWPDCVVRARGMEDVRGVEDVRAAVGLAISRDWRIAVASGGHSWSGSHLRDDGLLLDVSALSDQTIDGEACTAGVGPGVRSEGQRELLLWSARGAGAGFFASSPAFTCSCTSAGAARS